MHSPAKFLEARPEVLKALIHEHPFATVISAADELEAEHVPVLFEHNSNAKCVLIGHVARANPIWQKLKDGAKVLTIFQGPNHYVSPSWYPSKKEHGKVVPTWNYVIVHVRGRLTWQHDKKWLRELLEKTTDIFERDRKLPWHVSDAPDAYIERLVGSIVGFEVLIDSMVGKSKLSQNRSAEDHAGVLAGLASEGATEAAEMLEWMLDRRAADES